MWERRGLGCGLEEGGLLGAGGRAGDEGRGRGKLRQQGHLLGLVMGGAQPGGRNGQVLGVLFDADEAEAFQ